MFHCGARQEINSAGSSSSAAFTWNRQEKGSSTEAVSGEPMEASKVGTRGLINYFMVITRTVTPPQMVLEVVLEGAAPDK